VRAKLIRPAAGLQSFAWSSYGQYLKPSALRPKWLRVDRLLGEKGIPKDSEAGRQQFGLQMERRRVDEQTADYRPVRRGWCLGSEEFRKELLAAGCSSGGLKLLCATP
jgi:hypothetical protein